MISEDIKSFSKDPILIAFKQVMCFPCSLFFFLCPLCHFFPNLPLYFVSFTFFPSLLQSDPPVNREGQPQPGSVRWCLLAPLPSDFSFANSVQSPMEMPHQRMSSTAPLWLGVTPMAAFQQRWEQVCTGLTCSSSKLLAWELIPLAHRVSIQRRMQTSKEAVLVSAGLLAPASISPPPPPSKAQENQLK